jgi:predicted phosphodiesterase
MNDNIINARLNTVTGILQKVIENKSSIISEEYKAGVSDGYVRKSKGIFASAVASKLLAQEQLDYFHSLYQAALNTSSKKIVNQPTSEGESDEGIGFDETEFDDRAIGETVREDEFDPFSRITHYYYKIFLREREAVEGTLTREQMEKIYHLYPYVTMHNVSQEFPALTFIEFKKVLRAFNITKDRLFPPHLLEEKTSQEIALLTLKAKERAAGKAVVDVKLDFLQKELKSVREKNQRYENGEGWVEEVLGKLTNKYLDKDLNFERKTNFNNTTKEVGNDTFAFFGDIHFGKLFLPKTTRFGRGNSKDILKERCLKIALETALEAARNNSFYINLICLGDLFECLIPENMHVSQKYGMDLIEDEQIDFAVDVFMEMFAIILDLLPDSLVRVYGIGGNHDRITKGRDDDRHRVGAKMFFSFLSKLTKVVYGNQVLIEYFKDGVLTTSVDNISVVATHGEESIAKKTPEKIMNMHKVGNAEDFTVIASGHLHNFKQQPFDEGINYCRFQVGSVCAADDYSINKLGVGAQPSFIIGTKAISGYGFDIRKVTLA